MGGSSLGSAKIVSILFHFLSFFSSLLILIMKLCKSIQNLRKDKVLYLLLKSYAFNISLLRRVQAITKLPDEIIYGSEYLQVRRQSDLCVAC